MRKNTESTHDNFLYLKVFLLIFSFFVLLSLLYRGIQWFSQSRFWGNDCSLLVATKKDSYLVQLNKNEGKIYVLTVHEMPNSFKKARLKMSSEIGIPAIGLLIDKNSQGYKNLKEDFFSISKIFSILSTPNNYKLDNVNTLDVLMLYFYTKTISYKDWSEIAFDFQSQNVEERQKLTELFKNDSVINDKTSIEIVNNTQIDGLGSKFGEMFKNIGYNVVSVSSGDKITLSKIIYRTDEKNITLNNLKNFLLFSMEYKNENAIADISIILGSNSF